MLSHKVQISFEMMFSVSLNHMGRKASNPPAVMEEVQLMHRPYPELSYGTDNLHVVCICINIINRDVLKLLLYQDVLYVCCVD